MKIYKNLWAGHETYFIKCGQDKIFAYGYGLVLTGNKWDLHKANYYLSSLREDREHYPVVGNINLKKIVTEEILSTIREGHLK